MQLRDAIVTTLSFITLLAMASEGTTLSTILLQEGVPGVCHSDSHNFSEPHPPVAAKYYGEIYERQSIMINILVNDTDRDGIFFECSFSK